MDGEKGRQPRGETHFEVLPLVWSWQALVSFLTGCSLGAVVLWTLWTRAVVCDHVIRV